MTLKFDGKIIRHVFYTIPSFVYHFRSISEFKLKLQCENAQSGSNLVIFLAVWPWRMTLKNNRAPLLFYFKLCASFRSHQWFQTGDTVRKPPIWTKIDDLWSHVTLQFDVWPWKTIGHLFYTTSNFVHHSVAIGEFKLELQSRNGQFG